MLLKVTPVSEGRVPSVIIATFETSPVHDGPAWRYGMQAWRVASDVIASVAAEFTGTGAYLLSTGPPDPGSWDESARSDDIWSPFRESQGIYGDGAYWADGLQGYAPTTRDGLEDCLRLAPIENCLIVDGLLAYLDGLRGSQTFSGVEFRGLLSGSTRLTVDWSYDALTVRPRSSEDAELAQKAVARAALNWNQNIDV